MQKQCVGNTATQKSTSSRETWPRSGGFPVGLVDQPFYGWVATGVGNLSPFQRA
jgi:hypothetical protein